PGFGYAVEPDPAHPTGQALCAKIRTAPELVDHLKRLTHPLRRTRPNGDPTACGADRLGRRFEPDSRGDAPHSRTIRTTGGCLLIWRRRVYAFRPPPLTRARAAFPGDPVIEPERGKRTNGQ